VNFVKFFFRYVFKETLAILLFVPGLIYLKFRYNNKKVLTVLNYHNFSRYNNYKVLRGNILQTGYFKNFEIQINFLKNNFDFIYPNEFFDNQCKNGVNVLITFDDGYKDNYDYAFPIIKKHSAKCIFFIVTEYIGSNNWLWHDKVRYLITKNKIEKDTAEGTLKRMNRGEKVSSVFKAEVDSFSKNESLPPIMMNWQNLKEIKNSGLRIGAHTVNHKILPFLKKQDQEEEINLSIDRLNKELIINSNEFAYPNGLFNEITINILKKNKIDYAFTTINGVNNQAQNKLELKRIGVNSSDSIFILVLKICINTLK